MEHFQMKPVKPAISAYIRRSVLLLHAADVPSDETIHNIRILMKKARAAMKLVRPQLRDEDLEKDISALRDVGRRLCLLRESVVARKRLRELKKEFPELFRKLTGNAEISSLMQKIEPSEEQIVKHRAEMNEISVILKKTAGRFRFRRMSGIDRDLLLDELEKTYLKTADIFIRCRIKPRPWKLHDFRKCSKDLLYQLIFFRPLDQDTVRSIEKRIDNAVHWLGRYNDLDQLIRTIDYSYARNSNTPELDELIIRIREKQDKCLGKVWPSAMKVFEPDQNLINQLRFRLNAIKQSASDQ